LLFLSKGNISKDGAEELARAECARRGIQWGEPVKVHRHFGNWAVWPRANYRGYVYVIVDRGTGAIKAVCGPLPR